MTVRDLKLAIACGVETEEIISLNKFFDDLFSNMKIYTVFDDQNLILFMKNGKFIMKKNIKDDCLSCNYERIWSVLAYKYHCTYQEAISIIEYKVDLIFNIKSSITVATQWYAWYEDAFVNNILIPYIIEK